jgi:hypothetical protein
MVTLSVLTLSLKCQHILLTTHVKCMDSYLNEIIGFVYSLSIWSKIYIIHIQIIQPIYGISHVAGNYCNSTMYKSKFQNSKFKNKATGTWSRCSSGFLHRHGWYLFINKDEINKLFWHSIKVKVKLFHYRPEGAFGVPRGWGSRISRQSAHEGGKVVSPTHRPSL